MAQTEDTEQTGQPEYIIGPMRGALDRAITEMQTAERSVATCRGSFDAAVAIREFARERVAALQAQVDRLEAGQ
jgi:hypothetical protein